MNDSELLELAAKAAGYVFIGWDSWYEDYALYDKETDTNNQWNPLGRDGDALRLAVTLRMGIDIGGGGMCSVVVEGPFEQVSEDAKPDIRAATRRAITRAASEIGKAMK